MCYARRGPGNGNTALNDRACACLLCSARTATKQRGLRRRTNGLPHQRARAEDPCPRDLIGVCPPKCPNPRPRASFRCNVKRGSARDSQVRQRVRFQPPHTRV